MKKKILFFATLALTLASCSNDEDLGITNKMENAIEFRTLTDKGTRAAITDETNILSFTVTGLKDATAGGGYLFNAFGITRGEDSSNEWDYTPKRFWPAEGSVDFYAYSPSSSKNITAGKGISDYTAAKEIEYTVPQISKANAQEDFLVARATKQDKNTTSVKLNFHHTLSRVTFFAKTSQENVTYTIHSVELLHLHKTGNLSLAADKIVESGSITYGATPTVVWTDQKDRVDYAIDMGESPIYLLNEYASILGETGAVLVLPQTTTISSKGTGSVAPGTEEFAIKVTYKAFDGAIYYAGSATTPAEKYFAVKDILGGNDGIAFEMGRQYNFYLAFGEDVSGEIKFAVDVSEWSDTPKTYVPELDNYKGLISDDLARAANPTFDTDQKVTYTQIQAKTSITANVSTFNFEGLEYFKNLENLTVTGVTSGLNLDASKNTLLTQVAIANSTLGEVNLSNTALETLSFEGTNTVTTLDASKTKLNAVTFASGSVINGDLDLSDNATLTSISLDGVTINGNLDLSGTGITSATIKNATFKDVNLSNENLKTLAFEGINTVTTLDASNNKLTAVTFASGTEINGNLDLSNNPTLEQEIVLTGITITGDFDLSNTNITKIEIKGGTTLGDVKALSTPSLATLEFAGENTINSLAASNGKLENVTFASGTKITGDLDLSNNILLGAINLTGVTITGELNLSNCNITDSGFTMESGKIGTLNLSGNKFEQFYMGSSTNSTTIGTLNISNNTALTKLQIEKVDVTVTLNANNNNALKEIYIGKGHLKSGSYTIKKLEIQESTSVNTIGVYGGEAVGYAYTVSTLVVWNSWTGYQGDKSSGTQIVEKYNYYGRGVVTEVKDANGNSKANLN